MQTNKTRSISKELDTLYGKSGTPEREAFRHEAYTFLMGQMIHDARKIYLLMPSNSKYD
jgi:hypothetical protein